jgi:hypothetical protein
MAKFVLCKVDSLFSNLIMLTIIGGGMIVHSLTSLTIKSYYGDPWGYVAFLIPFGSEVYLACIQLEDNMYNYTIFLTSFICIASLSALLWVLKNVVMKKVSRSLN